MLGQHDRAQAGVGVQRGGQQEGICMETMLKEFCPYAIVLATHGKGGWSSVHAA
jgi:hypothetical protein